METQRIISIDKYKHLQTEAKLIVTKEHLRQLRISLNQLQARFNNPDLLLKQLNRLSQDLNIDTHGHDLFNALFTASKNTNSNYGHFESVESLHKSIGYLEDEISAACSEIEDNSDEEDSTC